MQYLKVKNWEQFQHYKDRNPPWVKFHFEILASQDWVMLADASKLLACVCMLVASRHEGRVPNNPEYVKRVAYLDVTPDFQPLIDCGFLQVQADASMMQADARPETERETYSKETYSKETEREALTDFKNLELSEEGRKFAEENGIVGEHLLKCWQKFKLHYDSGPGKDWLKLWKKWVLNEKKPQVGPGQESGEKTLVGEELRIQHLGSLAWRRKRKMSLNPEQKRFLDDYEASNGFVWWDNLRQWKEGKVP